MSALSPAAAAKPALQFNMQAVVLCYIFIVLPLFDMLNGFLIGQDYLAAGTLASPSQIGRFIAIILLFAYTAKFKYSPYLILLFFWLFFLEGLFFFRHNNISGVAIGYANVIRLLYMYLVFVAFKNLFANDFTTVIKFLKYNVMFICLSVVIASFTGLANSTYGWGAGTKGFFSSGNGLGIYIGVATLILAAMKKYRIYTNTPIVIFGLSASALILLGTKTSFLMLLLVMFAGFWSGRLKILIVPVIILGVVQFFTQISDELIERFDIIVLRYKNSSSLTDYILSGRNVYVENAWSEFASQNPDLLRWLFGGGAFMSYQNPLFVRFFDTLESDVFDVFFMYGVTGILGYTVCLIASVRPFLLRPWMFFPIALLWGHSAFAGHVFFNGLGATLIVIILAVGSKFEENKNAATRMRGNSTRRGNGFRR